MENCQELYKFYTDVIQCENDLTNFAYQLILELNSLNIDKLESILKTILFQFDLWAKIIEDLEGKVLILNENENLKYKENIISEQFQFSFIYNNDSKCLPERLRLVLLNNWCDLVMKCDHLIRKRLTNVVTHTLELMNQVGIEAECRYSKYFKKICKYNAIHFDKVHFKRILMPLISIEDELYNMNIHECSVLLQEITIIRRNLSLILDIQEKLSLYKKSFNFSSRPLKIMRLTSRTIKMLGNKPFKLYKVKISNVETNTRTEVIYEYSKDNPISKSKFNMTDQNISKYNSINSSLKSNDQESSFTESKRKVLGTENNFDFKFNDATNKLVNIDSLKNQLEICANGQNEVINAQPKHNICNIYSQVKSSKEIKEINSNRHNQTHLYNANDSITLTDNGKKLNKNLSNIVTSNQTNKDFNIIDKNKFCNDNNLADQIVNKHIQQISPLKNEISSLVSNRTIKYVVDPQTGEFVSLRKAVELNIVNTDKMKYINVVESVELEFHEAIKRGLIVFEENQTPILNNDPKLNDSFSLENKNITNSNIFNKKDTQEACDLSLTLMNNDYHDLEKIEAANVYSEVLVKYDGFIRDKNHNKKLILSLDTLNKNKTESQNLISDAQPSLISPKIKNISSYLNKTSPNSCSPNGKPKEPKSNNSVKLIIRKDVIKEGFEIVTCFDFEQNKVISKEDAVKNGILNEKSGIIKNKLTGETLNLKQALDNGWIGIKGNYLEHDKSLFETELISFEVLSVATHSEISKTTLSENLSLKESLNNSTISNISERVLLNSVSQNSDVCNHISFLEAVVKGNLDLNNNEWIDTITGDRLCLIEAIQRGLVIVQKV